jgi:hypothetical protein
VGPIANRCRFSLGESAVAPTFSVEYDDCSCFLSKHAAECIRAVAASEFHLPRRIGINECLQPVFQNIVQPYGDRLVLAEEGGRSGGAHGCHRRRLVADFGGALEAR